MRQKRLMPWIMIVLLVGSLYFSATIFAETIVLKSGRAIEGKIIEKTDEYIKVDYYGVPLTYYFDEIERIDEGSFESGISSIEKQKEEIYPRDGIHRKYYNSGKLSAEIPFKDGKREGLAKTYYESGSLKSEVLFKNGKREGLAKTYYESGSLKSEHPFKNNKLEGVLKSYYENGKLEAEVPYKDGKVEGVNKIYYENGSLKSEYFCKNGTEGVYVQYERVYKEYYENGSLLLEAPYKDGKREGVRRVYYESGRLKAEAPYKDGKIAGVAKTYYESGELESEIQGGVQRIYDRNGNLTDELSLSVSESEILPGHHTHIKH